MMRYRHLSRDPKKDAAESIAATLAAASGESGVQEKMLAYEG